MPRVTFVKSARKDNPVCKKGGSYYWWKFRYGGKRFSLTQPRPSQLTQSAYYSAVRSMIEMVEDADISDGDDLISVRDEIVEQLQQLGEEAQDSLSNMPDSLQCSPTGELLQERADACENASGEAENIEEFDEDEPDASEFDSTTECDNCGGTGYEDEDEGGGCLDCNGTGEVDDDSEYNDALSQWESDRDDHLRNSIDELNQAISDCEV